MTTQNQNKVTEQITSAAEKIPFNPFSILTIEQSIALVSRLNPVWMKEHGNNAATIVLEHNCSLGEATLAEWLRSLAEDHLEAKVLTGATDSSRKMLQQVSAGSMAAIAFIVEDYARLKAESQSKFRISIRDEIMSRFHGETAERVFQKVSSAVGVPDVNLWMRKK